METKEVKEDDQKKGKFKNEKTSNFFYGKFKKLLDKLLKVCYNIYVR